MQEQQQTVAVGIDVGTTAVRCVIGALKEGEDKPQIIGVGEVPNHGLKKGVVININDAAQAVDGAIGFAERMAGVGVSSATVNINGFHIKGIDSRGTVAVTSGDITDDDLARVEDAATVLQLPQQHDILNVFPRSYTVDGQDDIKDPLNMAGTRLEVDAHVVTASASALHNLEKVLETTNTVINRLSVSGLGAAQSVISDEQRENGVAVLDIGMATTNLIVIDDGDVQMVSVIPIGGMEITKDLAIGLRTELNVAEAVKRHYKYMMKSSKDRPKNIKVVVGGKDFVFPTKDIELVMTARLVELFESVNKELGRINKAQKLPGGVTLTGGGAQIQGIELLAKEELALSTRVAIPTNIGGLKEKVQRPEYATAVGLMMLDIHKNEQAAYGGRWFEGRLKQSADQAKSFFHKLLGRFR